MAGASSEDGDNFDINLAPIIDCFTVLITYMLVSASFISLTMLEVQAPPPAVESDNPEPEPVKGVTAISLLLETDHHVRITFSGEMTKTIELPAREQALDRDALDRFLVQAKELYGDVKSLSVSALPTVPYGHLAILIESVKQRYDTVVVGSP